MNRVTKAVIPAAGLGTRFLPATIAQPKEMLPIVDKPVIQFVVEEAVAAGIKDILIVTGRSKRAIEDHFDPSFELQDTLQKKGKEELLKMIKKISSLANIHFIRQKRMLGLADAIYQAKSFVGGDSFAVLLGDTIIHSQGKESCLTKMLALHRKCNKSVVALEQVPKELIPRYGIASVINKNQPMIIDKLVEKPLLQQAPSDLAIASRYIFDHQIFDLIEKTKPGKGGEIQITDSMQFLADQNNLIGYQLVGSRYDIGNKVDFIKTNLDYALRRDDTKEEITAYIKALAKGLK